MEVRSPNALNRHCIEGVIHQIEHAGSGPNVSLGDVLDALGRRSFAPMLLVPALVAVSPLSGIIGMTSFLGLWIAAIAAQLLLRRDHIWFPQWMQRRAVSRSRVQAAVRRLRGPAQWVDEYGRKRLTLILHFPFGYVIAGVILCLGLAMPFLEFIPFSGSLAGFTVALLALGLLLDDGIFIMAGLATTVAVICVISLVGRTVGDLVAYADSWAGSWADLAVLAMAA
ncbi:MAG: exopolysaccharide biosynthesis protein [Pseudomonadota bacterium]